MQDVIDKFKSEAFGDNHTESIQKIEKEVTEKYSHLKNRFIIQFEAELKKVLATLAQAVETKLRSDQIKTPQDLLD